MHREDSSLRRVEASLRSLPDIVDCMVAPVPTGRDGHTSWATDQPGPVAAYIVPTGHADLARLKRRIAATAVSVPVIPVLVNDVPRLADGTPDRAELNAVPVLTEEILQRYQSELDPSGSVHVTIEPAPREPGRLHLDGLDPRPPDRSSDVAATPVPAQARNLQDSGDPAQALSAGPDLTSEGDGSRTLPEALLRTAAEHPDAGLHLVLDRGRTVFLCYAELLDRAQRILGGLQDAGLRPGDHAILQMPSLDGYFPALWACLLGGILPVTVAQPPGYDSRGAVLDKLFHAWQALRRPVVICGGTAVDGVAGMAALYPMDGIRVLDAAALERAEPVTRPYVPAPSDTAILQLSSGSTGNSKAIQITHAGVMEYVVGARLQDVRPQDTTVNWLPLDHVAGLLMFHLRDTVLGCSAVHVPTELVVAEPTLWLDLLERYRAAHSWSPNFGYKLVCEALRRQPDRHWDLSSVRSLINAGEQCTLPVMREFVRATAPFGLTEDRILLAWGMAETCTAISYKRFGSAGTVHRIRKTSLTGRLEWVGEEVPEAERATFLSMGPPTVGARFRICDEDDATLPEGRIGRLQVASGRVTPGYLDNPEANAEAFRRDGWFDTGDLAFLKDGELVITGRRKEVIIINGSHYFCHELEDASGAVPGVLAGAVAACGVPAPGTGSEQLVVFFVPRPAAVSPDSPGPGEAHGLDGGSLDTVQRIRAELARRFQLRAAHVIPIPSAEFPRTTSGKIQRTAIRQRFLNGDFDELVRRLDLAEGNDRTVPDAVYRAVWEPLPAVTRGQGVLDPATTLVVSDRGGLAGELTADDRGPLATALIVEDGDRFERRGPGRYGFCFADRSHWNTLYTELRDEGRLPTCILHLAGADPLSLDTPRAEQNRTLAAAGESLILAVQTHHEHCGTAPAKVITVSRGLHRIAGDEPVHFIGAITAAVTGGLSVEYPESEVRHIDLPGLEAPGDRLALCQALRAETHQPGVEVAWRGGMPYRRRLVKVRPEPPGEPGPLFRDGSCLVVTGGLGAVGTEVLSGLLRRFRLRLLILGRTPPPGPVTGQNAEGDARSEFGESGTGRALARLTALSGEVRYRSVDVTDSAAVAAAVADAERDWGCPMGGVLHLAGVYRPRLLSDEEPHAWREALSAKVIGGLHLAALVRQRPGARFVSFSSLLTVTPSAESSSYVAANRFLEALHDHLTSTSVPSHCVSWGLWRGLGLNEDNPYEDRVARRGILVLAPAEGRRLARVVLAQPAGHYFVGLDDTAPATRGLIRPPRPAPLEHVVARGAEAPALTGPPTLTDISGRGVPVAFLPDRAAGPDPVASAPRRPTVTVTTANPATPAADRGWIRQVVVEILASATGNRVDERRPFYEAGLDSIRMMRVRARLEEALGRRIPPSLLFQHPTATDLIDHLAGTVGPQPVTSAAAAPAKLADAPARTDRRIAIIGMAARFPGARDLQAYWKLISAGESAVREFSTAELASAGVAEVEYSHSDYVPRGGILDDADLFDAEFFGISGREAALMEPQHRLLLEICHDALEAGGHANASDGERVAVFASTGMSLRALQTYLLNNLLPTQQTKDPVTALQLAIGNQSDFAASRVAYRLGLRGPAIGVQTACSSSLVAVHLAAQALLSGDADMALAGAAAVHIPQHAGYQYVPGSILSRSGVCRAFDAAADGTVGGNGVAAVLLKRLDRALADGDTVHAVILGSAVNNDGADKVGFTAPGVTGQYQVIRQALHSAGVSADSIGYVETHGTGTELGDPIEFQALTQAFRESTGRTAYCAIGSAKPNIGHLDSAAGMAGLIKAVLSLRHSCIPPLAGFTTPNPALGVDGSPFRLSAVAQPWERGASPRRAGVSALGVGGTNAYLILEEAPAPEPSAARPGAAADTGSAQLATGPGLLPLSARTPEALVELAARFRESLGADPAPRPADVFTTMALGRRHHQHRLVLLGETTSELVESLDAFLAAPEQERTTTGTQWVVGGPRDATGPVAFVCAGQGTQRVGMARDLYRRFPVFAEVIDECQQLYHDTWGGDLARLLLADDGADEPWTTDLAQPALFAFEIALCRLWESLEVSPDLLAGHSVGEYAAFCAAGALPLEDGLHLTAVRGHLMKQRCSPGAMVAVLADQETVAAVTAHVPGVEIAVINGRSNHVLAGPSSAVEEAAGRLDAAGHPVRPLPGDHAFHCALVEPMLDQFRWHLNQVRLRPLRVAVVTGDGATVLHPGQVPDAGYFARQARDRVNFAAVLARLDELGATDVLEIGPDVTLASIGRRESARAAWTASQPRGRDGAKGLLTAAATLHCHGVRLGWTGLATGRPGRRIPLPTYPFQRRSHWIEPDLTVPAGDPAMTNVPTQAAEPAPPEDLLTSRILNQIRELAADQLSMPVDAVAPQVAFFDLGADSLLMINMLRRLERTFHVRITMRELFEEADSPERLAAVVIGRIDPERVRTLAGTRTDGTPAAAGGTPPAAAQTAVPQSAAQPAPAPAPARSGAVAVPGGAGANAPAVPPTPAAPSVSPQNPPVPASDPAGSEAGRLVNRQLDLMAEFSQVMRHQLALLGGSAVPAAAGVIANGTAGAAAATPSALSAPAVADPAPAAPAEPGAAATSTADPGLPGAGSGTSTSSLAASPVPHGPRISVPKSSGMASGSLTPGQRAHVDDLTRRLTDRTATSKSIAQRYRRVLADSRAVVGFRSATKEMLYPIAARSARGAHLEDVDGNRYVDITMGFGVLLFGHEPEFVGDAIRSHLTGGIRLGPRNVEAGQAAELLAEITGFDRVAFANSGTEANAAAMRLARAATGRDTVVMFQGAYHGHADNVLGRSAVEDGLRVTVPVASGIPGNAVNDLVVLEYGAEESLAAIEAIAGRVAAVMVEPVQSRYPGFQPGAFLRSLRELTSRHGIVLFFDEMLTGFRPHLRGAQGVFGVTPDIATYGKVIGGGYPIGAIAGRADLMDGIDGGYWSYGDDSYPPRDTTFFGGTYIQHPLAMVAATAVLTHLKRRGPQLQDTLNTATDRLVGTLNAFFAEEEFPIRIAHFGSLFRFEYRGNMELFFHHLLLRGVYVWEWRNFFLSTAHTEQDLEFLVHAVRNALFDMRRGGFLRPDGLVRSVPSYSPPRQVPEPAMSPAPGQAAEPGTGETTTPVVPESVIPPGDPLAAAIAPAERPALSGRSGGPPGFSLYFFGDYPRDNDAHDKYAIVVDSARFADENGFHAVWLPERHFHSFGGVFPNPAVLGAALARETRRIRINAGCVVLPLHNPIRVAEEWSVIDNLSGGRVGIGCATGWHPNDFVLQPDNYGRHKEVMYEHLRTVQALWRGEEVRSRNGHGDEVGVRLFPKPIQQMPPFYTAVVGNPDSYRLAAQNDIGVITNLMTQSVDDLAGNIALYRRERAAAGLDPSAGRVVVLVHSYLGDDLERVRAEAFPAFSRYMRSSLSLFGQVSNSLGFEIDYKNTPEEDLDFMLERAYARYCESRALIGTPESASEVVDMLVAAGVDEIAYFIDFGVTPEQARASLPYLDRVRRRYRSPQTQGVSSGSVASGNAGAPLSSAQQRLWFLNRLQPGVTSFNECVAIRLDGALDVRALRTAVGKAVERHPALRTVFRDIDGEPLQFVLNTPHEGPQITDLSGQNEHDAVRKVISEESAHRFNLETGPLLRTWLLRFSPRTHVLVINAHHIVFDTWSAGVLTHDLNELYAAALERRPDRLPVHIGDHAEYAAQEQLSLAGEEARNHLDYWRERLSGAPPYLNLPADRPRPSLPSGQGANAYARFTPDLTKTIRDFARGRRATPFMVLLAAYYATIRRLTGQDDLVIGTPVANRPSGTENLVGFFVNTLALRVDLSGDPSFEELLDRVRSTALDAYEHQDLPFEEVVRALNPDRDVARTPLVQVLIEYETESVLELDLPGIRATTLEVAADKAPFDLTLYLIDLDDGVRCRAEYSTELFDEATVRRFLDLFEQVLEAGVRGPHRPLPALGGLTDGDRALLARAEAPAAYTVDHAGSPPGEPVHHRVVRQSARTPDAVAVACDAGSFTYQQLDERSRVLALRLRDLGCGKGSVVGVLLPRGPELAAALLAVLRVGGAYLALDPAHPKARLAYMLEESKSSMLLSESSLASLPADTVACTVLVDTESGSDPVDRTSATEDLCEAVGPDDLACVIYTSGSTGRPKGAGIRHGGLANLIDWHHREFATGPSDRASWISSPAFDACGLELWAHLAAGASLHPVPEEVRIAAEPLHRWLLAEQITSSFFTTPLAELLLDLDWPADAALRLLIAGGDRLRRWRPGGAMFRLINVYGPTEATVVSTWSDVPERGDRSGTPTIGTPVPGTRALVLDEALRRVPVGAPGELYLAGAHLAAGYMARPELTQERFIAGPDGHGRCYRTGDVVRRRNDGELEFLGRADRQVKIRGYRVEPGEVEQVLRGLAGIRDAAVVARTDRGDQPYLAGYPVMADGVPVGRAERAVRDRLAAELRTWLPDYLVPQAWVFLPELPVNTSGKIDRIALPQPDLSSDAALAPPENALEKFLHDLWATELDVERVAVDRSFFELGGHSLNVIRMLNRIQAELDAEFPMIEFFRAPTIRSIAERLKGVLGGDRAGRVGEVSAAGLQTADRVRGTL